MARSLARETAMKLVYAQMMGGEYGEETVEGLIEFHPTKDDRRYLDETVNAVIGRRAAIDAIVAKYLVNWTIERLARVDLSILRLAVFELLCRSYLCARGGKNVGNLHRDTIAMVKATAQAEFVDRLLPLLTEEEMAYYRRGKNAHVHAVPKSATAAEYAKATGLEALFGALYLAGKTERINELFKAVMEC